LSWIFVEESANLRKKLKNQKEKEALASKNIGIKK
jgi:hypothetical protein